MKKPRIAVENLAIELTRKCNLKCNHCMRGNAENKEISDKILDRIFEGKGGIRKLTRDKFTRGDLITDGTIMALTRVMNGEIW